MALGSLRDLLHYLAAFPQSLPQARKSGTRRAIRIGYAEAARFGPVLPQEARELRWYFAHASVGSNILEGLRDLSSENPAVYTFGTVSSAERPPTQTSDGVIYEHNRGNPGWKAKVDQFACAVQNGWRFPKVNVVLNKLCYIDQFASANYYINSMSKLEAAYPDTLFVYATMPLTTGDDWKNRLRNSLNDRVRQWTSAENRVLLDIADIEAHESRGNNSHQRLCAEYTDDGGHLNSGGRKLLARAFYALAAALVVDQTAEDSRHRPVHLSTSQ